MKIPSQAPYSIRRSLMQIQLAVAGTVLLIASVSFIFHDIIVFRRQIVNNLDSTTRVLGLNLAPTLSFMDNAEADKILRSLKAEPGIVSARLFDRGGKLFARYGSDPLGDFPLPSFAGQNHTRFDSGHLYLFHKLYSDGELMGTLLVVSDTGVIWQQAQNYALIALAVFLAGLGLAFLMASVMQRKLSEPIISMAEITKRISASGDYSLRVGTDRLSRGHAVSEILTLSQEFDRMIETIQQANQETQQMLLQASKLSALGEMAGGIAHEVNNPLATIKLTAEQIESLLQDQPLEPALIEDRVQMILKTVSRISSTIRNMLSFARAADGSALEPCLISELVANTLLFCGERFKRQGIELLTVPVAEGASLLCRGNQLSQVLLNLLNNACDAVAKLDERWVRIEARVSVSAVELRVSNSGPPIPPEVRRRLFQPFFTTKEAGKGTGLGLSISQKILASHQGSLALDEAAAETTFVARVPRTARAAA